MEEIKNTEQDFNFLSVNTDKSTCDYYENLYSIPVNSMADNIYSEAEYGNYNNLYERVDPNCP